MAIGDTLFEIPTALVDSGTSCLTVPAEAMDNMV
jgi:pepsin A